MHTRLVLELGLAGKRRTPSLTSVRHPRDSKDYIDAFAPYV